MRCKDSMTPSGDPVQIILKKKGTPVAGIYKTRDQELRSKNLPRGEKADDQTPRNG